ncbi:hypothetical protein TPR58_02775 [Sphingomonas sp. HF-S3]|uniref:DUF3883 domain-containing protein n=1 Tax=Sphingomonas rustica TaxID=3103142 RepID=A0ABV0B4E5_9SPHN
MTNSVSVIVEQLVPSRIDAIDALRRVDATGADLRVSATRAAEIAKGLGRMPGAKDWRALDLALETVALLTEWAAAVETAEADAERYLRAARQKLKALNGESEPSEYHATVTALLDPITAAIEPEDVARLRGSLAAVTLPVAILADPVPEYPRFADDPIPTRDDLAVAFLEFTIDRFPAANLHALRPNQVHDLGLIIRVSRWPQDADRLDITPVSVEPPSVWDLPRFTFPRPDGDPPYTFQADQRMIIHAAQGFDARPLEFIYAAQFQPSAADEKVVVAGQRRLRLDGIGAEGQAVSGYGELDRSILDVRQALRGDPMIPEDDVRSVMLLLPYLANLAGASVQDALYPSPVDEATFEKDVRDRLRGVPSIGGALEQQAYAAGGRTDLSFRGVRLELKSERSKRLLPADCERFAEQAAMYAVGTGKRVAVLCVLDCSRKTATPLPLGSCLFLHSHDTGAGIVSVVTVLVQGGFPKPSAFSR